MVPSTCIWIYVSVKSFFLSVHTIPGLVFQRIFSASVMAGIGVYLGRHIHMCEEFVIFALVCVDL